MCIRDRLRPQRELNLIWLTGIAGFGLLGLLDDTLGNRQIKGLRGHFQAAFRERKITTGFIKAVGGGLLALLLAYRFTPSSPLLMLLDAALIALCANAINLFDLRPGRACGVFLITGFGLLVASIVAGISGTVSYTHLTLPTIYSV